MLKGMEQSHINERGWRQIGQNITTFPDGAIALCRPIDIIPAGIFGANTGAICLEHVGFFDHNQDKMTPQHAEAIVRCNAILCRKFQLPVTTSHVVYHHWYNANGKRFSDSFINSGAVFKQKLQKTCPGTNFFGGHKVSDALVNFLPLIQTAVNQSGISISAGKPTASTPTNNIPVVASRTVSASILNVRAGRGTSFPVLRQLHRNTVVNVYLTLSGWSKIDPAREEWVAEMYL